MSCVIVWNSYYYKLCVSMQLPCSLWLNDEGARKLGIFIGRKEVP